MQNFQAWQANKKGGELKEEYIKAGVAKDNTKSGVNVASEKALKAQYKIATDMLSVQKGLTVEEQQQYIEIQRQVGLNIEKAENIKNYRQEVAKVLEIEDANSLQVESSLNIQKQRVSEAQKLYNSYKQNLRVAEELDAQEREALLTQNLTQILNHEELLTEEQKLTIEKAQLDLEKGKFLTSEQQTAIEKIILSINDQQVAKHRQIAELLKLTVAYENGEHIVIEQQNQDLERQGQILKQNGQSSLAMQKGISRTMAAAQGLTALLGSVPTLLDESISGAEKMQAKFSAASGVITAISSAFGPVGMAIGMVGSALVSAIGTSVVKGIEEQEKKIKEVKQEWEDLVGDISTSNQNISSLESIASEFEYLSTGVSKYGENVSLTSDEYERYQDLINEIVKISPNVVEGYDNEGKAIVNKNGLIEDSIRLLKEEQEERKRALLEDKKIEAMAAGAKADYNTKKGELTKTQNEQETYTFMTQAGIGANGEAGTPLDILSVQLAQSYEAMEKVSDEYLEDYKKDVNDIKSLYYDLDEYGLYSSVNFEKLIANREVVYEKFQALKSKWQLTDKDLFVDDDEEWRIDTIQDLYDYLNEYATATEKTNDTIEQLEQELQEKTKSMNSKVVTWLEVYNDSYKNMTAEQQLVIQKYIESLSTTDFSLEGFKELTTNAETFTTLFTELSTKTQEEIQKLSDPSNYATYKEYLQGLWDLIENPELDENSLNAIADAFGIESLYKNDETDTVTVADDMIGKIHEINNAVKEKLGSEATDFDLAEYFTYGEISSGSLENMGGIDLTQITSIDDFITKLNIIKEGRYTVELSKGFSTIKENIIEIDNALNEFEKDGIFSEETLEKLEKKYAQLGNIQNKNSHEYLQTLREIREEEEKNARESLEEKITSLEKQADFYIDVDTSKFNEVMEELLKAKYQLEIEINADLNTDIEDGFGLANEFEELRSMITDDLKISFEEAQEFIKKGYGEILTNAQETNEGVIQLNEEQTKAFIKNKEAELEVDKDKKIKELNTQKAMLTAQLNILQEELKAYLSVSEVTEDSDKTQAMNKALLKEAEYQGQVQLLNEELKKDNEQKVELTESENEFYQTLSSLYQQDAENSMLADEDADKATETYHRNVINYYDRMHQAAAQYAAAVRAASAGQSVGDFTVQAFSGEDIDTTSELDAVNEVFENEVKLLNVQSLFDSDKWNKLTSEEKDNVAGKLAEDTQKRIDSLKSQLGSIDSAIAALNTSTLTFDKEYEGIGEKTEENNEKK